ncbi:MAG TPA: type II toxin-antitoxin system prevent-host-death family antitoxin [Stellaceae bacterium]|nr:type II toxin-antitoxin system prevent-host-death family antitoxin [Stellaceae bacterium]
MRKVVNMHEAKTTLSRLVDQALKGDEVVVSKSGRPVVRLVPVARTSKARRPGRWKGRVSIARDFDELPKEIRDAFEGKNV